mmetsp:Transcript_13653/g.40713  ORF Transcript_13653/g.40713 Transcript_13653/m.40713 type:complete len:264 (+) Transcript_13653:174-965(+)
MRLSECVGLDAFCTKSPPRTPLCSASILSSVARTPSQPWCWMVFSALGAAAALGASTVALCSSLLTSSWYLESEVSVTAFATSDSLWPFLFLSSSSRLAFVDSSFIISATLFLSSASWAAFSAFALASSACSRSFCAFFASLTCSASSCCWTLALSMTFAFCWTSTFVSTLCSSCCALCCFWATACFSALKFATGMVFGSCAVRTASHQWLKDRALLCRASPECFALMTSGRVFAHTLQSLPSAWHLRVCALLSAEDMALMKL